MWHKPVSEPSLAFLGEGPLESFPVLVCLRGEDFGEFVVDILYGRLICNGSSCEGRRRLNL